MQLRSARYILVIFIIMYIYGDTSAQDSWDVKDPVDLGAIDFADNKLLGYNLVAWGMSELFTSAPRSDSARTYNIAIERYDEYRRPPLSDVYGLSFKAGYHFRKYLSLGWSTHLYAVTTDGAFSSGLGGRVWFAWHILSKEKVRLSYDNGVGPNYFFEPYPQGGTRFNFTSYYGLQLSYLIDDHWWSLRLTNIHISNADIKGRERNPAMDAVGVAISVEF